MTQLLRFKDLQSRGIIGTWPTLARYIATRGFPAGRRLGYNRVWTEQEVDEWIAALPDAKAEKPKLIGGAAKRHAAKQARADIADASSS